MEIKVKLDDAFAAIDADIDRQIAEIDAQNGTKLDQALLDKLLRPFVKMIEAHRTAGTNPDEFFRSAAWIASVLMTECILNITDKSDVAAVQARLNDALNGIGNMTAHMLEASITVVAPAPTKQ